MYSNRHNSIEIIYSTLFSRKRQTYPNHTLINLKLNRRIRYIRETALHFPSLLLTTPAAPPPGPKNSRRSLTSSFGLSHAAKCPPLSCIFQKRRFPVVDAQSIVIQEQKLTYLLEHRTVLLGRLRCRMGLEHKPYERSSYRLPLYRFEGLR